MAKIISDSWIEDLTEYSLNYGTSEEREDVRFGFPCDEHGNVQTAGMAPLARANFDACMNGSNGMVRQGIVKLPHSYRHPAVLLCDCGRHVTLHGFTCPCDCGRDYNSSGSLLAPRSQWGEETGESLSDILRIR